MNAKGNHTIFADVNSNQYGNAHIVKKSMKDTAEPAENTDVKREHIGKKLMHGLTHLVFLKLLVHLRYLLLNGEYLFLGFGC